MRWWRRRKDADHWKDVAIADAAHVVVVAVVVDVVVAGAVAVVLAKGNRDEWGDGLRASEMVTVHESE